MSCKREIDVLKCYSNDPKRFLEDLADCIKYKVYCELRLVSVVNKSKLINQISPENLNYFTNHFENEKYNDFNIFMSLIKNVYINNIVHLSYKENEVLIDYTYLKNLICQIDIIFKNIKKENIDYQGNENLRDFKDIICYPELLQDKKIKKCNFYYQATSLYEISIKLKEENAYDINSDQVIRKYYYEPHNNELQSTKFIHNLIESFDQSIHNNDLDFHAVLKLKGRSIPINIRYAADKNISTIGNKISRKNDLLSNDNIPWSITLIKDYKRMSITFTNEYHIYLYIMQLTIKFGQDFTEEFISEEHNIRIRIAEIKNGFFGLNSLIESGDYRDVKIIYEFFIPDQDISYMMECQLNLNELVYYKKAEHIIYDFLRCENDMLSVKKQKEMYSWYVSNSRIFLYNLRLIFVILAIATIGISTGIILNYFNLDYNLILHSNYQKNFQFIQGLYPNNICYSIDKKLYSCIGNKLFYNLLNNNTYNNYKKLVLSEELFIGIDNSSNVFYYNLIDYNSLDSSLTISDIQINNNILCRLMSNSNDLVCNHIHVYPRIIEVYNSYTCISANNQLKCFGYWTDELNYPIPLKVQSGVDQLSLNTYVHCAIKYTQLYCWGNNEYGQLDIPSILLQQDVSILSTGITNICAGNNDILVCWGRDIASNYTYSLTMNYPPEVVSRGVEIISAKGSNTACAVTSGELYCWGGGDIGQDNIPEDKRQRITMMTTGYSAICIYIEYLTCYGTYGMINPPNEISLNTLVIKLNFSIGCASTIDKFLCWDWQGNNVAQIPEYYKTGVDQIALGNHLCISFRNNYECLNYDSLYEYPIVDETTTNNFNLPMLSDILTDLEIGGYFCVSKGILYCKSRITEQKYTRVPKQIINSTSISISEYNVCALSPNKSLICIGDNEYGQNDVPFAFVANTTLFSIGIWNICASTADTFLCWGEDWNGQLDVPDSMTHGVQVVTVLYSCTCAGTQDEFRCWGDLDAIGDIPDELVGGVDSVDSGRRLVCASKGNGFYCFGNVGVDVGQLDVPALFRENGVDLFGVGNSHVCAQKDSAFLCWGNNALNQTNIPAHFQGGVDLLRTYYDTNCASIQGDWTCFGNDYIDHKFLISEKHTQKYVSSFSINGDYNLCIKYSEETIYCKNSYARSGEYIFKVKEDLMCMYNLDRNTFLCYTDRVNSNQFICNSINNSEDEILYSYISDSQVVKISCGLNHGCAMFASGEAICFGGSADYNEAELSNSMITGIYDIRAGYNSTCIVNTTQILCIGKPILEENYIYDLVRYEGFESISSQLDR